MALDSQDYSYIDPYLMDWVKYVRDSYDAEQQVITDGNEFWIPYSGATKQAVNGIFIISEHLSLDPYSKYLAVHLFDKYMARLFWELISDLGLTESTLKQVRESMSSQTKLVLATCLQIASKVDLYRTCLGINQIQQLMLKLDPSRHYSRSAVFACEVRILKSLDFRLPVCLPYETVELFVVYAGLATNPQIRETCLHLLDVAYLRHSELIEQLHLMARGRSYDKSRCDCRDFLKLEANSAFVAAAVVVCSSFFFNLKRNIVDVLAAKLASLIDMSPIDLNIMANILFTYTIDEDDFKALQLGAYSSGDEVD